MVSISINLREREKYHGIFENLTIIINGEEYRFYLFQSGWGQFPCDHMLTIKDVEEVNQNSIKNFITYDNEKSHFLICARKDDTNDYSHFLVDPRIKVIRCRVGSVYEDIIPLYVNSFFPPVPQPAETKKDTSTATRVILRSSSPVSAQSGRFLRYATIAGVGFLLGLAFRR